MNGPSHDAGIDRLLQGGDDLFAQGQCQAALGRFLGVLQLRPAWPQVHYRVGLCLWRMGQHDDAWRAYEQAIRLDPDFVYAHCELGRVLLALGQIDLAQEHARRAVELAPGDKDPAIVLASIYEADRQPQAAWDIAGRLLQAGDESTDLAMVYGRLARPMKREADALALVERLLQVDPPRTPRERSALHFTAANLLDPLGRYDEAFEQAVQANALRGITYDPASAEQSAQQWIDYFTPDALARLPRATHGDQAPVFIIGMPRSGTTLVEQILASHPAIHGAGELDWVSRLCQAAIERGSAGGAAGLRSLDALAVNDLNDLAAPYLASLKALAPAAARITDKMPTNFFFLGMIALLFPDASVIHCRRDAMDTCLSCFMTDFAAGYEFSFSQPSLGHFYGLYDRLMSHWKRVLPLRMLEVDYEQLVGDLPGQARRMVEFLGQPWDERCLRFHENRRFVVTASNAQVRLPIYASSVGRWRHYEKHLAPLAGLLGVPRLRGSS